MTLLSIDTLILGKDTQKRREKLPACFVVSSGPQVEMDRNAPSGAMLTGAVERGATEDDMWTNAG